MESFFQPSVLEILSGFSKLRILVIGKPGCGKSALLSKVFGIDAGTENARVTERLEGAVSANIEGGLTFGDNDKFVLYASSREFLPNCDLEFKDIRDFIGEHLSEDRLMLSQRIHAIWICIETPLRGERLNENGIERILEVANRRVPIVVVLTKFDKLVASITNTSGNVYNRGGEHPTEEAREEAERLFDDTLKKVSLDSLLSQQLVTTVSTMPGYEDMVAALIQSTDGAIQRYQGRRTHESPVALAWAIAQRHDLKTTVAAVIDVGRKKHWVGLNNNTDFKGRMLEQCVSVIHEDIIMVWNIRDDTGYLGEEDFKARMSHLVEDLAFMSQGDMPIPSSPSLSTTFAAATASPISAIGAVAEGAKWVSNIYQATPNNIACIMGYIVDLVMVLTFLSEIHRIPATASPWHPVEEEAVNAIKAYISSGLLSVAHEEIRKFTMSDRLSEATREDSISTKIARLVENYYGRAKAPQKPPSPMGSVISVANRSQEPSTARSPSIRLQRQLSARSRIAPRHGAQEPTPDILTIVEEATKPRSSEAAQRPTLLIPPESVTARTSPRLPRFSSLFHDSHVTPDLEKA